MYFREKHCFPKKGYRTMGVWCYQKNMFGCRCYGDISRISLFFRAGLRQVREGACRRGAKGEEGEGEGDEGELQAALRGGKSLQQDLLLRLHQVRRSGIAHACMTFL
jgi:hypothetical protein